MDPNSYKRCTYKKGKVGDKDAHRKKPCDKKTEIDDASVNQGIPMTWQITRS